jgi:hypothetical protein
MEQYDGKLFEGRTLLLGFCGDQTPRDPRHPASAQVPQPATQSQEPPGKHVRPVDSRPRPQNSRGPCWSPFPRTQGAMGVILPITQDEAYGKDPVHGEVVRSEINRVDLSLMRFINISSSLCGLVFLMKPNCSNSRLA